jgi:4-azaleucine resistance transporter AzlC
MAFGLIARNMEIGLGGACSMSMLVFAGASQFMALSLLGSGVGAGEIVVAALLMNFRHFLMSASLSRRVVRHARFLPLIAFGLTDETFVIASTQKEKLESGYLIGLESVAYSSWVGGTVLGYTLGQVLPEVLQRSLGISLYALFIAILIPAVRRSWRAALVAALAGLCHVVLRMLGLFSSGWNIIVAILLGAGMGAALFADGIEDQQEVS